MREKIAQINGLSINYKVIGAGKIPVVLLHGWGISSDKYVVTAESILAKDSSYVFYIPDLPGFGKSEEPKEDWKLDDYVQFVKAFLLDVAQRDGGFEPIKEILEKAAPDEKNAFKLERKKIVLIAHSFGGRIAIKYAEKYPEDLERLVLIGAAGIKHKLTSKQKVFFRLSKIGKALFNLPILRILEKDARRSLYGIMPDKDYGKASVRMKEIMKNALKEDLSGNLEKINVPAILIWGENDRSTPLEDGRLMKEKIRGSKLHIIKKANHSAPYNNAEDFSLLFVSEISGRKI